MIATHRLSDGAFESLAAGYGGADTINVLRHAQLSKHLLLIRYIAESWPGDTSERDDALAVLAAAQRRAPGPVSEFLAGPSIATWATWVARRLRGSASSAPLAAEAGHLSAIAAVSALIAGLDASLAAHVRDGLVALPVLGALTVPLPHGARVRIEAASGALTVTEKGLSVDIRPAGEAESAGWLPLRWLAASNGELGHSVAVDDLDPYCGDRYGLPAGRIPDGQFKRWQTLFAHAWDLLTRYVPERADELRTGLRAIVPLVAVTAGPELSATSGDSFGMLGASEPGSAVDFAMTMVHEFQHSKLNGVLDIVPLYDSTSRRTYFAPWRTDPRPIGALLQGIYAFLGIATVWERLRENPDLRHLAERNLAAVRTQVDDALTTLARSEHLTPDGVRFAAGMRSTLDTLLAVPVPARTEASARDALRRSHQNWLRRNGRESRSVR